MKHSTKRAIRIFFVILGFALLAEAAYIGGTMAQNTVSEEANEFSGVSRPGTLPETPEPFSSADTQVFGPGNRPILTGTMPEKTETPAGPFDPAESPKTDDSTNLKILLTGLCMGVCMLREIVFTRKRKEGG